MKLKLFLSHFYNLKVILLCKLHRYGRFWVKHMALYCAVCYNKKKLVPHRMRCCQGEMRHGPPTGNRN